MTLADKISELFEYRGFPRLIDAGQLDTNQKQQLKENLIRLQTEIYGLDAILEADWILDDEKMDKAWDRIHETLGVFSLKKPSDDYLRHIKKYEYHEKNLRKGKLGFHLGMEYFYFYKSCDVKLMRRLIYEQIPTLQKQMKLSAWRDFDLITEVNDDVADMIEDMDTINGNRFLLSYLVNGAEVTRSAFRDFILQIQDRNPRIDSNIVSSPIRLFAEDLLHQEIHHTLGLIDQQLEQVQSLDVAKIKIMQYLQG